MRHQTEPNSWQGLTLRSPSNTSRRPRSLTAWGASSGSALLSPVDLTQAMLERIAKVDPRLKSYATVMHEQALADARAAHQEIEAGRYRGPLHGVPIGIKDLCYTQGVRTMGGTAVLKNFVPTFDSTVVSKLRSEGAVMLGKLNLSEAASAGYNPAFDVAPAENITGLITERGVIQPVTRSAIEKALKV